MIVELSPSMFEWNDDGEYTIVIDITHLSPDYHRSYCIFVFYTWSGGWLVVVQNRHKLYREIWPNESVYYMGMNEEERITDFIKVLALKFAADVLKQDPLIEDVIIKI